MYFVRLNGCISCAQVSLHARRIFLWAHFFCGRRRVSGTVDMHIVGMRIFVLTFERFYFWLIFFYFYFDLRGSRKSDVHFIVLQWSRGSSLIL